MSDFSFDGADAGDMPLAPADWSSLEAGTEADDALSDWDSSIGSTDHWPSTGSIEYPPEQKEGNIGGAERRG